MTDSQPPSRISSQMPAPPLLGLVVACLILDLAVILLLQPDRPVLRHSYTPMGLGILLGQFALMGAIRLRYDTHRWLAYGAMVALTAMGGFILRAETRPSEFYPSLLIYLVGAFLLALFCIVPGAIVQARYHAKIRNWHRFQLKHLLAWFIVMGTLFTILAWSRRVFPVAIDLFFIGLPSIVANLALAQTHSMRRYSWCLLIVLSIFMLFILSARALDVTVLFGIILGQGVTIWLGGIYLLSFRQRSALMNETDATTTKLTTKDID